MAIYQNQDKYGKTANYTDWEYCADEANAAIIQLGKAAALVASLPGCKFKRVIASYLRLVLNGLEAVLQVTEEHARKEQARRYRAS